MKKMNKRINIPFDPTAKKLGLEIKHYRKQYASIDLPDDILEWYKDLWITRTKQKRANPIYNLMWGTRIAPSEIRTRIKQLGYANKGDELVHIAYAVKLRLVDWKLEQARKLEPDLTYQKCSGQVTRQKYNAWKKTMPPEPRAADILK